MSLLGWDSFGSDGAVYERPGRLMSLGDIMFNFSVGEIYHHLWMLRHEEETAHMWVAPAAPVAGLLAGAIADQPQHISDAKRKGLGNDLAELKKLAEKHKLEHSLERIKRLEIKSRFPYKLDEFIADVRVLRESLESDIWSRFFYCYSKTKSEELIEIAVTWKPTLDKFNIANKDIFSAVDCWALGHPTASVFHLMRVAEYGLRALARERRVKLPKKQALEWAEWRAVIDGIGKKVELIANKRRGPARDEALEFYRGAMASFEGFKDAYRNNVMHSRKSYAAPEAFTLIHHVRDFMNRLSSKIDETGKKQIKWGIR